MLLIRRYGTGFLCVTNGEKVLFMKCARWAAVRGEERSSRVESTSGEMDTRDRDRDRVERAERNRIGIVAKSLGK